MGIGHPVVVVAVVATGAREARGGWGGGLSVLKPPKGVAVVVAALLFSLIPARAGTPTSVVRPLAGAEVDWSAGTVTASAGAAADMRMPSPAAARPGAQRRARAAAVEKLRAALRALPLRGRERLEEKQIDAALGHASVTRVEYQSNGGVVLWLGLRFEEVLGSATVPATAPGLVVLSLAAMPLELAPLVVADGREVVGGHVRYHQGQPPAGAIRVSRDDKGRLVLPRGSEGTLDRLAGEPVVIYLQRILP